MTHPVPRILIVLVLLGIVSGWTLPIGGIVSPATGPRDVLIVRESEKDGADEAVLFDKLQSSDAEFRAYLTAKGHRLFVLDDDAKGENNQPLPLLAPFQPIKETGEVLILSGGKLVARDPMPATVAEVLALIKKAGG